MPTVPQKKVLTNVSSDVLNVIRNQASANYQNYVPVATPDAESIRAIGAIIMDSPNLQNEFLSALINRIGRVLVTSRTYENPWAIFKKGTLDFGEVIEEVFVELATPRSYDPEYARSHMLQRSIPDVRSAYHVMNYQKFYKQTVQRQDLARAFMSVDGVTDLIEKIIGSMYTAMNYDEFLVMKYMLAKQLYYGRIKAEYPDTGETVVDEVTKIKSVSNLMTYMSKDYNVAGVRTYSDKDNQYLIVTADFEAKMDVNVLAVAFHMDKAEFMGHLMQVDSFASLDMDRLEEIFTDNDGNLDPNFIEFTDEQLEALAGVDAVLVDENYFMIIDNMNPITRDFENGEGLYWNYWLHTWKTFSVSPYANAVYFVKEAPTAGTITISVPTDTMYLQALPGNTLALNATVEGGEFTAKTLLYSTTSTLITVDKAGVVSLTTAGLAVAESTTATVTITLKEDEDVTESVTVTILPKE